MVLILSFNSPDLISGEDQSALPIAAFIDWLWGLLAVVAVLRATVFRRPTEKGWGQDDAWMWITIVVGGIWVAAHHRRFGRFPNSPPAPHPTFSLFPTRRSSLRLSPQCSRTMRVSFS